MVLPAPFRWLQKAILSRAFFDMQSSYAFLGQTRGGEHYSVGPDSLLTGRHEYLPAAPRVQADGPRLSGTEVVKLLTSVREPELAAEVVPSAFVAQPA